MLDSNIEITTESGEYKEYPFRKSIYLYGKCVWSDDFADNVSNKEVIDAFYESLKETSCYWKE